MQSCMNKPCYATTLHVPVTHACECMRMRARTHDASSNEDMALWLNSQLPAHICGSSGMSARMCAWACVVSHAYVLCHSAVAQQEHYWQVDHAVSKTLLHVVVHLLLPMLHAPPSLVWSGLAPCIRLKGTNMAASLWSHASCMCNNNGKSMGCKGVGSWCYAYIQPCV